MKKLLTILVPLVLMAAVIVIGLFICENEKSSDPNAPIAWEPNPS